MGSKKIAIVKGEEMCVLAGHHYMWDKLRGLVPGIVFYNPRDKRVPSKKMKPKDIWKCLENSDPLFVCVTPYAIRKMVVNGKTILNEKDEKALRSAWGYEGGCLVMNAAALREFTHRDRKPFAPHLTTYADRGRIKVELASFASGYLENILAAVGFSNEVTYRTLS